MRQPQASSGNANGEVMKRQHGLLIVISFFWCGLGHADGKSALPEVSAPGAAAVSVPLAARRAELVRLVRQDCGSCHGLRLSGGLGPALLPDALGDKPADSLVATILRGRPGTPMPPWHGMINEEEAQWIVRALQQGFPEEAPR